MSSATNPPAIEAIVTGASVGGITIVQDPKEAQVATKAALDLHRPDHIFPVRGIGRLLVELERIAC